LADFSTETWKVRSTCMRYFEHWKKTISVFRYSIQQNYHSKLMKEWRFCFHDKQKPKQYMTVIPPL
jgi:hypothetical protein